jgi:hypothetical protein
MSAFKKHSGSPRRWWYGLAILGIVALVAAFTQGTSRAVVSGSPSGFESSDGNMTVQGTTNSADWNCFANGVVPGFATGVNTGPGTCSSNLVPGNAVALHPDANNPGGAEVSWKAGQKLDAACPVLTSGSTPNKDDFTDVASYNELDSATPPNTYLYGAEIRSVANGSSSGNLELNQVQGPIAGCSSPIVRTAGDKLLAFDFSVGGTVLDFHALTWITVDQPNLGGNSGICDISHDSLPCWGNKVVDSTSGITIGGCNSTANDVEGCANQLAIAAADNGLSKTALAVNQFAEFGVNLTKVLQLPPCESFPQEVWESRTSGQSFTSNPEDIEIEHHTIANCGEIKVIKQTDPRGINKDFSFTSTIPSPVGTPPPPTSPNCLLNTTPTATFDPTPSSFTLNDGTANTEDCTNVVQGTYTVTEGTEPGGFSFESLNCSVTGPGGSTAPTSGETATIHLKPGDTVTCTYVNQQNTASMMTQVSTTQSVFPGVPVHDTATVTGSQTADTPSGTVTFSLCGPTAADVGCSTGGTSAGTGTLSGSLATASANSSDVNTTANPLTPGHYCFRASWPGDNNYPTALTEFGGASGTNECFTVNVIQTKTETSPQQNGLPVTTVNFGSSVTDHALVTALEPNGGPLTGTVKFFVCNPTQTTAGTCTASPPNATQVGNPVPTVDLGTNPATATADSDPITANQTGTWCFRAEFTPGTSSYLGSSDARATECFLVRDQTTSASQQNWLPNDTTTVTATHGAPLNGTLSAQLFTDGTCGTSGGSAVSGQLYTKMLTNATSAADRTLTTGNTTFTVGATTAVSWFVQFASNDTNVDPSSHCESTSLTVSN